MTEEEVRKHMGQLVRIKAPGMKKGIQQVRIVNYNPNITSPWGKGVVTLEFPNEPNKGRIKHSISQIELSNNGKRKRHKRRKNKIV